MADPDSDHPLPSAAPKRGNMVQISSNITKLTESRQELLSRIQNLKQDLQNWKGKMDTQVKVYHSELSELKSSLNTEVEQLRSEFQELRTTPQQQQQDIGISLKTLGLHDEGTKAGEDFKNVETSSVLVTILLLLPSCKDSSFGAKCRLRFILVKNYSKNVYDLMHLSLLRDYCQSFPVQYAL